MTPPRPRRTRPAVRGLLAGAVAAGLLGAVPAAVAQPSPAQPSTTQPSDAPAGDDFAVEEVPGGYRVELQLDEPLEVRSDAPVLEVDGEPVGVAVESADGRSLSVVTPDAAVLDADRVSAAWAGEADAGTARAALRARAAAVGPARGPVLGEDPGTRGRYGVRRADYDLGDQVWGLEGLPADIRSEARAAVYLPAGARGERPVVVIQHGRHSYCLGPRPVPDVGPARYPCAGEQQEIPSYLGYDELAENLASHGYAVVSVSTNAVNANDNQLAPDLGAQARGDLVLHHLDLLARADAGEAPELGGRQSAALRGRLDLDHVGLMGHSRGGEGVVEAALMNAARPDPYGVEAVLPLAPVDFARPVLPDVPMAVVLPYCDGDVSNLQGQHFYDDSRYTTDDDVLRSSLLVMGANHNWFNTEWTPGTALVDTGARDDWRAADPLCGTEEPERLTPAEQRAVGTAYMGAFFRMVMGGEEQFQPMFDGTAARAASAGRAVVHPQAQAPGGSRVDVNPLDGSVGGVRSSGSVAVGYCQGLDGRPVPTLATPCAPASASSRMPHWTPASRAPSAPATTVLTMAWPEAPEGAAPAQLRVDVPAAARDMSGQEVITVRAAPTEGQLAPVDALLSIVDGRGREDSVLMSQVSDALAPLPAGTSSLLPKTVLRTVELPLSAVRGVDLRDVRQVRLTAASPTGSLYLSDVAVSTAAVGAGGPTDLPQVSVGDAVVAEGDGPGSADVAVRLSAASEDPVSVRLESLAGGLGGAGREAAELVFAPGETCQPFAVPLVGDDVPGAVPAATYSVTASVPVEAVTGDAFGVLTVVEDDGVVVDGSVVDSGEAPSLPLPGPQGDVCAA
ncbi:hypothetical protein [uncultured Pseudokineococcus sp.]|uniref:hypothetical protein n=1 Tax=uncultured Pseudokineococcus sp. TaxID=1642928 RepID=UPI00260D4C61|nr:hypothetical protein [uncultured Pseudokineococcus sp.]